MKQIITDVGVISYSLKVNPKDKKEVNIRLNLLDHKIYVDSKGTKLTVTELSLISKLFQISAADARPVDKNEFFDKNKNQKVDRHFKNINDKIGFNLVIRHSKGKITLLGLDLNPEGEQDETESNTDLTE